MANTSDAEHAADTEAALKWITDIFHRHKVPFQITGGLAAQSYGSDRELFDIDIYMPFEHLERILPEIKDYIIREPGRTKNECWNLINMDIEYAGARIDLCDADNTSIFDSNTGKWIKQNIDFSGSTKARMFGIDLPMMPKEQLLEYKRILSRDVDKVDLEQIS